MDSNITLRPTPLPYPETPCVESWHAANPAPQPQQATPQPEASAS